MALGDVDDIKFVINFDYPNCSEDYVHRIGRTARSNKSGTAYTFFTTSNGKQANDLIGVLQEANQAINPRLYDIADTGRGGAGRMRNRGRPGFQGRNDMRGGRRDDTRGGRTQGRDSYGPPRGDRMRDDDRSRANSRPDRSAPPERSGYNRESQGSSYNRSSQGASYNRNAPPPGYNRENGSSGFNRDGQTPAYNRDSNSGFNRESQASGRSSLLNTPQSSAMYQPDAAGAPDSRYSSRSQTSSAPRSNPSAPHPPGPPANHNMNGQYMNGQSRGGHTPQMSNVDRHGARSNPPVNSHNGPPPQRYENHNMPMNGPPPPHRNGQHMNGSARPAPAMTNAQAMQSLFQQPPPPPPPIPATPSTKGSLMGPPPPINKYY